MLIRNWGVLACLSTAVLIFNTSSYATDHDKTLPQSDTYTGTLQILIADNFESDAIKRKFALHVRQTDDTIPLSFTSNPPDGSLRSGDQVTIKGIWLEDTFEVASLQRLSTATTTKIAKTAKAAPPPIEIRKAVVLVVGMGDAPNNINIGQLEEEMSIAPQNVNDLYQTSSFGHLGFDFHVFGDISISDRFQDGCDESQYKEWAKHADEAAEATIDPFFTLDEYQHRIYVFPEIARSECQWDGMGELGGDCENSGFCRVWVTNGGSKTIAHELGHNITWQHGRTDLNNNGWLDEGDKEYGDESGIMGKVNWAQANAPHRDQLGWFNAFEGSLVEASTSDTFNLHALELDPDTVGTQVVKIEKPNTREYYYLSYRREISDYPSFPEYANKINIHRYIGTGAELTYHITNLEQGESFEDEDNGITVTAEAAGSDIEVATVSVELRNIPPTADFSYSADNLTVQFSDASQDNDGGIESHTWDFDDGTTSEEINPTHMYGAEGTYSVKLTVTDDHGEEDTSTQNITVEAPVIPPKADFTYTIDSLSVQFTDTTTGSIARHEWDFGDGVTSLKANPNHLYTAGGTYTVKLTVTSDHGDTNVSSQQITVEDPIIPDGATADFTYSVNGRTVLFSDTSAGTLQSRIWNFGDGATSDQAEFSHTYQAAGTYSVSLTITDENGGSDTEIQEVAVSNNQAPTADFEHTMDGLTLFFSQTSSDEDGTIENYHWDFGDGVTSAEPDPEHVYEDTGDYTVRLTVLDNEDAQATEEKVIRVESDAISPAASTSRGGGGGGCFIDTLN